MRLSKRDWRSRQVYLYVAMRSMNRSSINTPSGGEGVTLFSNIASERLEHQLCQEIRHCDGNRLVLVANFFFF